jgi:hypothetical protein
MQFVQMCLVPQVGSDLTVKDTYTMDYSLLDRYEAAREKELSPSVMGNAVYCLLSAVCCLPWARDTRRNTQDLTSKKTTPTPTHAHTHTYTYTHAHTRRRVTGALAIVKCKRYVARSELDFTGLGREESVSKAACRQSLAYSNCLNKRLLSGCLRALVQLLSLFEYGFRFDAWCPVPPPFPSLCTSSPYAPENTFLFHFTRLDGLWPPFAIHNHSALS